MAKTKSLLEQALDIDVKRTVAREMNHEEIEVALAWLADEITITQAAKVMGFKGASACVSRLIMLIREAYRAGLLKRK